jgi:outer membrane protein OmpA-like peptidoglycan-associated protein
MALDDLGLPQYPRSLVGRALGYLARTQQRDGAHPSLWFRDATHGTGIEIERQGDELLLHLPAAVTFQINRFDIQPQFRPTLDQVAQTLNNFPSTFVDVYGHTDPSGGDAINIPLSNNRARAVADYLAMRGVNPARIASQGFGSSRPLPGNTNATEAERQANRRVEIRIVPVEQS